MEQGPSGPRHYAHQGGMSTARVAISNQHSQSPGLDETNEWLLGKAPFQRGKQKSRYHDYTLYSVFNTCSCTDYILQVIINEGKAL